MFEIMFANMIPTKPKSTPVTSIMALRALDMLLESVDGERILVRNRNNASTARAMINEDARGLIRLISEVWARDLIRLAMLCATLKNFHTCYCH